MVLSQGMKNKIKSYELTGFQRKRCHLEPGPDWISNDWEKSVHPMNWRHKHPWQRKDASQKVKL